MGAAIIVRDIPGVISVFELQGKPIFSLWETAKEPIFSCADEDEKDRRHMLDQYLDIIKQSGSTADFTIKFHDEVNKNGKVNNTTPVMGSLRFKLNDGYSADGSAAVGRVTGGNSGGNMQMMNELFAARLQLFEEKYNRQIEDLQREHEEEIEAIEEEQEAGRKNKKLGAIGQITDHLGDLGERHEWLQEPIKDLISWAKENIQDLITVGKHKLRRPAGANIAGVNDEAVSDTKTIPPDLQIQAAVKKMIDYYAARHGGDMKAAWDACATDMTMLANLTNDPDIMELALKKLHQLG